MLILAGVSLNAIVGDNGIITQAQNASIMSRLSEYKEEFEMNIIDEQIKNDFDDELLLYAINEDVKKFIPSLNSNDVGRFAVYDSKLVYISNDDSSQEKIAQNLGYLIMSEEDYNYMFELNLIERAIKNIENNGSQKVGTEMGTNSYGQVSIAGMNYGLGWYIIGNNENTKDSELSALGISTSEKSIMTHSPYIVKYNIGAVQSINGKMMYAGTDYAIWKYTFNYTGEENNLVIKNLVSGVSESSSKTESEWGNFYNYGDDGFEYIEDENGNEALNLSGKDVANLSVDQTIEINKCFSVSITIKGDTENQFTEYGDWVWQDAEIVPADAGFHGGSIISMSDVGGSYILWLSILHNRMRIITYRDPVSSGHTEIGADYISDLSEYDEKYMNIQITAERGGLTKVYINGILKLSFESGSYEYSYRNLCIGDLRTGRGLKYKGNVYDFALYGDILTEEEIAQNWNYVKNKLNID